mmetsp:Transcript_45214/g.50681  ORF Transcript_45214/g.50681 Transcript_45214/m.50681 type:complete len:319 (+) Transcript_45214:4172-5128(+)
MIAILSRKLSIDTERISTPSILTLPANSISTIRKRVKRRLLFPDPVRPTTPKVLPGGTDNVTRFKTNGDEGLYFIDTFLNSTPPFHGQPSRSNALSVIGDGLRFNSEGKLTFSASPALFISLGIAYLFSIPSFLLSFLESISVNSLTRVTLIICDSSAVRFLTAHAIKPVIARLCVNPQAAEPDWRRPVLVKKIELMAVMNTMVLPIASKFIDSQRSSALPVEKTDKFTSDNFRCRDDHMRLAPGIERIISVPRSASLKCVKIGDLVRCSLRFISRAAGRNRFIIRRYMAPANVTGIIIAGEMAPASAKIELAICREQ